MNIRIALLLVFALIEENKVFAQNFRIQKIIITTPQAVIIDPKLSKKLARYEELCIQSSKEPLSHRLDSVIMIDTLPKNELLYFKSIKSFIGTLSLQNNITYSIANSMQTMSSISKKNQSYIPLHNQRGISLSDMEIIANENNANYVIFIDTVKYKIINIKAILDASLNLYDNVTKEIIYKHLDLSSESISRAQSTCNIDNEEFIIYNRYTYDLSQIYRLLAKESELEKSTIEKKRKDYLLSVYDDTQTQNKIKSILYSNSDTSKICEFYRGIINKEGTKFIAVCIKEGTFYSNKTKFPNFLTIVCTGTYMDSKWIIEVRSRGGNTDSNDPEKVKLGIFLGLAYTKLFIEDSAEINQKFWSEDEYKKIRPL